MALSPSFVNLSSRVVVEGNVIDKRGLLLYSFHMTHH